MNIIDDYSEKTERGTATFVQAPAKRMIRFVSVHGQRKMYYISFPHIVHSLEYISSVKITGEKYIYRHSYKVLFATSSAADKLYLPPLPNLFSDGEVCLGDKVMEPSVQLCDVGNGSDLLKNNVRLFWQSGFNHQLSEAWRVYYYRHHSMSNLHYWETKTKSDPLWIPGEDDLIPLIAEQQ